jgi:RNA polymerase sigma-70 factor (ECF subfamily)
MLSTQSSLLVRLRMADDSEAWNRFVRIYTPLLLHWIKNLGIEANHRFDVCQEVFLVLLDRSSWLARERPTSFRAWLRTVTLNKCRDHLRQKRRDSEPRLLDRFEVAQDDPAALLTDNEYRVYVAQQALRLMREAFAETTWRACWENVVANRPAADVAQELGISVNAVYLARGRVLKRLREELDGLWE